MAYDSLEKHKPWGLRVPGRPPTPSEGAAQQYARVGPRHSQRLFTFENGTCLEYGPDDLVDEFDFNGHPFINQVAVIDKAIRDIKAVRDRYQTTTKASQVTSRSEDENYEVEEDPFDDFRSKRVDLSLASTVVIDSLTYSQVPSKFATINNLISIYSYPNKGDVPGEKHPGVSSDTRFGTTGKPPFDTIPRHERLNAQSTNQDVQTTLRHNAEQTGLNMQNEWQGSTERTRRRGRRPGRSSGRAPGLEKRHADASPATEQSQSSQTERVERTNQNQTTQALSQAALMDILQTHAAQFPEQNAAIHPYGGQLSDQQQHTQMYIPQQTSKAVPYTVQDIPNLQHNYGQTLMTLEPNYLQEQAHTQQLNFLEPDSRPLFGGSGSSEYVRFLDDQNTESRRRKETNLGGDILNREPTLQIMPPSPGALVGTHRNPMVQMRGTVTESQLLDARNSFAMHPSGQGHIRSETNRSMLRSLSHGDYEMPNVQTKLGHGNMSSPQLYQGLHQGQQDPRQLHGLYSPSMFNPAGRSLQSMTSDVSRFRQRIGSHTSMFGEQRPGSAASSSDSSDERRAPSLGSGNTSFGQVSSSTAKNTSPFLGPAGFGRVDAIGTGRRLWDSSRASSPGLELSLDGSSGEAAVERGRSGLGHGTRAARRSVSMVSMRDER